jgi:hypothetical protein
MQTEHRSDERTRKVQWSTAWVPLMLNCGGEQYASTRGPPCWMCWYTRWLRCLLGWAWGPLVGCDIHLGIMSRVIGVLFSFSVFMADYFPLPSALS